MNYIKKSSILFTANILLSNLFLSNLNDRRFASGKTSSVFDQEVCRFWLAAPTSQTKQLPPLSLLAISSLKLCILPKSDRKHNGVAYFSNSVACLNGP